jgi:putative polyhydroxyalkanoate system protein
MADIDIRRGHALGLEGARAAADRMLAHLAKRFDLAGEWRGNVLHFERPGVNGSLHVDAEHVHLSVALGFLLRAMKGSIESAIQREMDGLFPTRGAGGGDRGPPPRNTT